MAPAQQHRRTTRIVFGAVMMSRSSRSWDSVEATARTGSSAWPSNATLETGLKYPQHTEPTLQSNLQPLEDLAVLRERMKANQLKQGFVEHDTSNSAQLHKLHLGHCAHCASCSVRAVVVHHIPNSSRILCALPKTAPIEHISKLIQIVPYCFRKRMSSTHKGASGLWRPATLKQQRYPSLCRAWAQA